MNDSTCFYSAFLLSLLLIFTQGLNNTNTMMVHAANTNVYIVYMGERMHDDPKLTTESHLHMLANVLGSKKLASEMLVYSYKHGFSGFAAKLTNSQARNISKHPGVVGVMKNSLYKLQTTRSWDFLGLSTDYYTPNNILYRSNMGDGVTIGILDTGIWPESKSFDDEGLGPIPLNWKGNCESGEEFNSSQHCNRKIIGASWFVKGFLAEYGRPLNTSGETEFLSPRDANGHGTHVSSTAAGSYVGNISYYGIGSGIVRGGAPRARLAIYKVCWNVLGGQCASADILKGFDEAIKDGVDVLSLSIGSSIPLYSEVDERDAIATASFHAVAKGITVVCGAANDGPSAQTVQNTAPWILTVAATTIDRSYPTPITLGNNQTFLGQALYTGKQIGFTGLLYPEREGLSPASSGVCQALTLDRRVARGKVVLCFTSSTRRLAITIASTVVKAAGGVGLIVAKNPSDVLAQCDNDFPCVEVDYEIGTRILFYIRSTKNPMVKLSPTETMVGKLVSANVAHFSSRGPNSIAPSILKPDIGAPGVNILAATSPLDPSADKGFTMLSGTSMATPHVSGIVALLKAIHPHWSPAALKSAIITTAWKTDGFGIPTLAEGTPRKLADPFDFGGGIVNPNGAASPGLVFDMNTTDYVQYLCAMDYGDYAISKLTGHPVSCSAAIKTSILDLNLPSITIPNLQNSVSITRTVTNVGPPNAVYAAIVEPPAGVRVGVRPNVLNFNANIKKISFKVTVISIHQLNGGYYFGNLIWTDGEHFIRIPISVRTEKQHLWQQNGIIKTNETTQELFYLQSLQK